MRLEGGLDTETRMVRRRWKVGLVLHALEKSRIRVPAVVLSRTASVALAGELQEGVFDDKLVGRALGRCHV